MNRVVQTKGLTKKYKNFYSVQNLNISVREGNIYGFLGPN